MTVVVRKKNMDYKIREIKEIEYPVLSDFLYDAIYIPEGMEKPAKLTIKRHRLPYRCMRNTGT